MLDPTWVLAIATVVLAAATAALVYATYRLFGATQRMDEHQAQVARYDLFRRKVFLVNVVLTLKQDSFVQPTTKALEISPAVADLIQELAPLLDFEKDGVFEQDMKRLLLVLREVGQGTAYTDDNAKDEIAVFVRIRDGLAGQVLRMQSELATIAHQIGAVPVGRE